MDQNSFSPPPAYSEQEFDQKISLATDLSTRSPLVDEDGWELYDLTSFENTVSASTKSAYADDSHLPTIPSYKGTSSSSENRIPFEKQPTDHWRNKPDLHNLPLTTPLRIEKKSQPTTQYRISNSSDVGATYGVDVYPRKSFYPSEDPGNFSSSSQANYFANLGEYQTQASSSRIQSGVNYEQIVTELEDESGGESHSPAPPSFEDDVPPLNEIESERIETPTQVPFVIDLRHQVSCPPTDSTSLSLQLPLNPEPDHSRNLPVDPYYHTAQPISFRRSGPEPRPLPQVRGGARPISSYQPPLPLMNFNPSIAYTKVTSPPVQSKPSEVNPKYDPHSFYK